MTGIPYCGSTVSPLRAFRPAMRTIAAAQTDDVRFLIRNRPTGDFADAVGISPCGHGIQSGQALASS
jgi:hypothetical protein